jgi:hypothetical protein
MMELPYLMDMGTAPMQVWSETHTKHLTEFSDLALRTLMFATQIPVHATDRTVTVTPEIAEAAKAEWRRRRPEYNGTLQWARQAHVAAWEGHGGAKGDFGPAHRGETFGV